MDHAALRPPRHVTGGEAGGVKIGGGEKGTFLKVPFSLPPKLFFFIESLMSAFPSYAMRGLSFSSEKKKKKKKKKKKMMMMKMMNLYILQ